MVDDASVVELRRTRTPLQFARIVVIGGGCYGSWYTQQLSRAFAQGALTCDEVVVVDRNANPLVKQRAGKGEFGALPLNIEQASWSDFVAQWLASSRDALQHDALVPSPLMPHLLFDWLISQASARWPSREVRVESLDKPPDVPWQRAAPDKRHYVSFAEWMCPVNCIEPRRCPHTRGERTWSMPVAIERYTQEADDAGAPLYGPVIFHCVHRTWGVGMIDAAPIVDANAHIAEWAAQGPARILVGTMSHCHGALGVLVVE